MKHRAAEQRGRRAETIAAWWLRLHGWSILATRARVPGGEVDLVARRGRTLAFVEVKARTKGYDLAISVDEYRLRRVAAAATLLAPRFQRPGDDLSIDVVLVGEGWPRHLANVWHGG